jgi:hypothetical protein
MFEGGVSFVGERLELSRGEGLKLGKMVLTAAMKFDKM